MNGILWLASYPKSGNTWLRIFLTNYWRAGVSPADINEIERTPIASARHLFDEEVGICSGDLTLDEIDHLRPAVYLQYARQDEPRKFCKVHDAYTYLPNGRPLIPPEATSGVIYLLRNPLDVVVSYADHNYSTIDQAIEYMSDDRYALSPTPFGKSNQLRQRLLSWSNHVLSWCEAPDLRRLLVRYEDMIANPIETFTQIVRFTGDDNNPQRIQKAITFSSFDEVKRQEEERGFCEKRSVSPTFFRKGKVGTWRDVLTDTQMSQIVANHREVMRRFGYLTANDEIVY